MKNKSYFYTIFILVIFSLLALPTPSISSNYKYTQDIENEKKDKLWSAIRQRIGEVYEVKPNKVNPVKFVEWTNSNFLEFIVTKKEEFTIVDGYVASFYSMNPECWLSFSETRPPSCKMDGFSTFFEIIFASGKVAYFGVTYYISDENSLKRQLTLDGIRFVKKQPKKQVLILMQESKNRKQR